MKPDKNKDQHIIVDERISAKIVNVADVIDEDVVLEIGGGPGNLTEILAKKSKQVYIVEKDQKYCMLLKEKFAGRSNVKVIPGDVLNVDLPNFDKIVSNPPYQILQEFFYRLIKERKQNFKSCIITVPYGFAKLITNKPASNEFGVLSALFYAFYDVEILDTIPEGAFNPKPRVLSNLIRIVPKTGKKTLVQAILEYSFLHETQKMRNVIMKLLWNRGEVLLKRKVTKNDAREIIESFDGNLTPALDKGVFQLSTREISMLCKQLLRMQS
ncbi:MAG: methyltransferase domain-containing protein [Candidatus Micrarchaeales archaeon]|nr:methyltransferase domain-containing protein [Candidatus Micrarchaeales archaeon]